MNVLIEWAIFIALSGIAVITAAGLLLTMSMYRAGLALMSSFVALAGLFILLNADLLAAIQVMMNVGGMLVMILFMVMIMMDPGGEMMWDMKRRMRMPGPGAFSMTMPRGRPPARDEEQQDQAEGLEVWTCPMHPEVREKRPGQCPKCGMDLVPAGKLESRSQPPGGTDQGTAYTCPMHPEVREPRPGKCPKCGMDLVPAENNQSHTDDDGEGTIYACPMHPEVRQDKPGNCPKCGMRLEPQEDRQKQGNQHEDGQAGHEGMAQMSPERHHKMMVDMAMSTAQLPWALVVGAATAAALIALVVLTPWPISEAEPAPNAAAGVGALLLSRYMIAFEGAAFMILAGIVAAVIFAKREGAPPTPPAPDTEESTEGETYTCPMHSEVQQTGPGRCPICGMELVPTREVAAPAGRGGHGHGGDS